MAEPVKVSVQQGIAVLALNHPPVNVLNAEVRDAIGEAITSLRDSDISALVLTAEGKDFSGGLELKEMDRAPEVGELAFAIEDFDKPVIAALKGRVLGAGASLALAAHWRVASADARIAFPEIRLGLMPGAGATQRLPRLIGEEALVLMLLGGSISGTEAKTMGLVDEQTVDDVDAAAFDLAQSLVASGAVPRPTLKRRLAGGNFELFSDAVAAARNEAKGRVSRAIIECVEAAQLLPPEAGLAMEEAAGEECWKDPASRAARYLFQAERKGLEKSVSTEIVNQMMGAYFSAETAMAADSAGLGAAWRAVGWQMEGADGLPDNAAGLRIKSLAALVNRGAALIKAGIPADEIDLAMVKDIGFPRHLGGPMHYGEELGLAGLLRRMDKWRIEDGVWEAHPVLKRAAVRAEGFEGLEADG